MNPEFPELHAFLALPRKKKVAYLVPRFRKQRFEWREGGIETDDPLQVIALVTSEECQRRFQTEAADDALGGIFGTLELGFSQGRHSADWKSAIQQTGSLRYYFLAPIPLSRAPDKPCK